MIEFISQLVLFCCDEAELVLAKESSNFTSSWSLNSQKSSTIPARRHTKNASSQIDFSARVYGLANSVGLGSDQKNKKLFQGRQFKIIADLYLMAGRFPEAAKTYMKAIDQTRTNIDNLFHVSSLEGYYCTMLLISSINEDLAAFSYKGVPDELLVTISDTYLKDMVKIYETISHPLLQAECYLKVAKLLTVVWKLGTSKPAIDACIGDDFESSEDSENLKLLRNKHKLSRSYISSWAMRAWKPADNHLTVSEKVGIFSAMAAIFEILGYNRKQAFFLRQSALLLLPKLTQNPSQPVLTVSEDTVRVCLNRVCQGYWIDTQLGPPAYPEFKELKYAAVYPKHQGWVTLQKNVYKECIKLSEAISDFSSMGKYIFHMLLHLYPYLTKSEQEENGRTLLYLVQGHALQFSHLDISTTLPSLVSFGGLKIDPSLDMYPLETTTNNGAQPAPLVFSFKKDDFAKKLEILVVDESFEMEILLTNPFRFPLELDEMQLLVEGVAVSQKKWRMYFASQTMHCLACKLNSPGQRLNTTSRP
ncbi:hypothetical protein DSO57_1028043 [Entomophthora muscae]|uniref:Uncharacterized protein n=1 Tax=Entomophthora muscae TaxID=34485 RepID=A0ACC2UBA5_9FUNG|nr:hypothetical protein DSO57_1028043 [Entomophthora muscae]